MQSMFNKQTKPTMKLGAALLIAVGFTITGCQQSNKTTTMKDFDDGDRKDTNAWLIRTYQGQQVENAIARQHTIWSHHFVEGTTVLTPRGFRDLGILRAHYARYGGGILTVRQGEAGDELYEARLATLSDWLTEQGVPMATVDVQSDLYTGDGKRSTRAAEDYVRPSSDEPFAFHGTSDK